jgi:hypothetical protein
MLTQATEKLKNLALRREVQIIFVFGVITAASYYIYLKNRKDELSGTK